MAHLNTIEIPVSNSILTTYAPRLESGTWINPQNFGLFNDSDRFVIVVLPDGYDADASLVSSVALSAGSAFVTVEKPARTIQIETSDCREAIALILRKIWQESDYKPFQIYDYHRPEEDDLSQGYTVRNVTLASVKPIGGTISTDSSWGRLAMAGTRITFTEIPS